MAEHDAKMRKRGRLLLEIENDKRFPDIGTKIRDPANQRLPINEVMINWLADEAKDAAAVLDHLLSNPDTCARIGYSEEVDARRQLESIDDKLFSKAAPQTTEALRSIFGKKQ
ncbi:hypothetical protein [Hyphomicrobium methylovorum]|uniref:hypothetical protein n=1 Tax=Hyphomicrobium methylovorum TaxID=84 RepID=UPI0015E6D9EA|nr:hypothetical protein [Hyphomicrobium methylovorum]